MPVEVTYPGVYIEEVPSGVRAISGVATSIAAFCGWAPSGPVDRAVRILSWPDFERQFGGLDPRSVLGYAVYQFFGNGGQQAYVVRLVAGDAGTSAVTLDGKLKLLAKNPGRWGEDYSVTLKQRADDASRFGLRVFLAKTGQPAVTVESFDNLSIDPADRRSAVRVINVESLILNAELVGTPTTPPGNTAAPAELTGGGDGAVLSPNTSAFESALDPASKSGGIYLLDHIDLFNILCVPGETAPGVLGALAAFCRERRAFLVADCAENATFSSLQNGPDAALTGAHAINAAFYFPWVMAPDPLAENRPRAFPPCGFVAGLYARTDATRGVWKAPAGTEASLSAVAGPAVPLTDKENGVLNVQAINGIRSFPIYGTVLWGARTLRGHNEVGSEWKYVPVRRLALFLEESLYRGTQWAVFEPNDEPLWAQIRLNVGAFLQNLFRQGAFQGRSPREAYFVKCDGETTTQTDINAGIVNIVVGFAPLKPAEFVIIRIQQMAGQIQT